MIFALLCFTAFLGLWLSATMWAACVLAAQADERIERIINERQEVL